jgi:hypothetical protein
MAFRLGEQVVVLGMLLYELRGQVFQWREQLTGATLAPGLE